MLLVLLVSLVLKYK